MHKRVAVFRNTFLQPSEVWLYNNLLAHERYEVRVFCRRRIHGDRFPFPATAIRSAAAGRNGPRARAEEVLYALFRRSPRLARSLAVWRPDLLHAHFGVDGVYALAFAARFGVPLVVSVHGYDVSRLPRFRLLPPAWFLYYRHFEALAARTSRFIAHTRFTAAKLREKGVSEDSVTVHYLGIPVERYAVDRPAERRPPNVLFVGRFVEKKGIRHTVRAFARIADRFPESRLLLVGSGPLREEIEREIGALGLGGRVELPGFVAQEELRLWFERAAVFCHPSLTSAAGDAEGIVISNLEAQAAGLPVVATRHGGVPEGVVEGETGFLVAEGDTDALARALATLLGDEARRAAMSRAAVRHIRSNFDVGRQTRRLERIYDHVLHFHAEEAE